MRIIRIYCRNQSRAPRQCDAVTKPLWIPLKRVYFEAFERGEKTIEYRRYGARWCEQRCYPGRPVTLSLGYSGRRLCGVVRAFERSVMDSDTYGPGQLLALIHIEVMRPT
jgi:hypothetical protein